MKLAIDDYDDNLTISLLLTRRCNFECSHCFYECGPYFRGYMGDKVLYAVKDQVALLQSLDIGVTINLIGGEPTLNLDKFGHILDRVMSWDVSVEMTTNGWWLHKPSTTRKFFNAVRRHVDLDGTSDWFSVRISNDSRHDVFRPPYLRKKDALSFRLAALWEYDEDGVFYKQTPTCTECGHEYRNMPEYEECTQSRCDGYVEYEQEEIAQRPPMPHEHAPWIYVESNKFGERVVPTGRGQYCGNISDHGDKHPGSCLNGLSYLPNGKLMDICCMGSWCEFGTVYDHPVMLLELAQRFVKQVKPNCWNCRDDAKAWKRRNLSKMRHRIQQEISHRDENDLWEEIRETS